MSNLDSILQIQIENKAYYLTCKTKLLLIKTEQIVRLVILSFSRRGHRKNLKKNRKIFEHRRKPKLYGFSRQNPSYFELGLHTNLF